MSNTEIDFTELRCGTVSEEESARGGSQVEVLSARDVPLGGPRAMTVRRTLPQRARTLIGAWCFADHYGPDDVARTGGMDVAPHPHTGLQTVSWLFSGEIEHRDSLGTHAFVVPGELNLMTGGYGISHSEVSTAGTTVLHGVQLWLALPEGHRATAGKFEHHVPSAIPFDGGEARVFLGSLAGGTSPVPTFSPLLGAELTLEPRAETTLAIDPGFEHGLLVDHGDVLMAGTPLRPSELGYLAPGGATLTLKNPTDRAARMILLGGAPFEEQSVMWWNFVARSHDEIVQARDAWQSAADRFGHVDGYEGDRLLAPALPNATITPRKNPRSQPRGRSPMTQSSSRVVERVDDKHRYEILVDGELAGFAAFRDRDAQRVFHHTEIDDAHAGQGLASHLVQQALTDARNAGKRIVPVCPYVARFIRKHDEFADVTDPVTEDVLTWIGSVLGD